MKALPKQLGLAISLREGTRFSNFYINGDVNKEPLCYLSGLARNYANDIDSDFVTLLWGSEGAGLSHLLQSACHSFVEHGLQAQYLPMRDLIRYPGDEICEGLEYFDMVCIDDVELIGSSLSWQTVMFGLFNSMKDAGKRLILSTHTSPSELPIALADLKSRLLSGTSFQIQHIDDEGLETAFLNRAVERGLEISADVASFIFHRAPRSSKFAFEFLDKLDALSLAEQRKITIPFVRNALEAQEE